MVDQDLKQMTKRQKSCTTVNSTLKQILDDPLLISNSTNNIKDELLNSTSNDTTIVNDTVPNWTQSGGQV